MHVRRHRGRNNDVRELSHTTTNERTSQRAVCWRIHVRRLTHRTLVDNRFTRATPIIARVLAAIMHVTRRYCIETAARIELDFLGVRAFLDLCCTVF